MSIIKSGTTSTTAYTVEANTNGDLEFQVNGSLTALSIDSSGAVSLPASSLTITSGATLNGGVVVNEPGADVDFRVEGDTDANLLFVDASSDEVGIGTNAPGSKFEVRGAFSKNTGDESTWGMRCTDTTAMAAGVGGGLTFSGFYTSGGALAAFGAVAGAKENSTSGNLLGQLRFYTSDVSGTNQQRAVIDSSGNLGIGTTSPDAKIEIEAADGVEQFRLQRVSTSIWGSLLPSSESGALGLAFNANDGNASTPGFVWRTATDGSTYTERMRLTTTGLGIGATSPGAQLEVSRSATDGYSTIRWSNTGASGRTYEIGLGGNTAAAGFANNLYFYDSTASATRMVIDASGNLGVGTTSPASGYRLTVNDTTNSYLKICNGTTGSTGSDGFDLAAIGSDAYLIQRENAPMIFYTNATERAQISAAGEVLINASGTSSSALLFVNGVGKVVNPIVAKVDNNAYYNYVGENTSGNVTFFVLGTGDVKNTNNSYGAISDEKMKQDIVDASSQWDDIKGLRVRKFRYKADPTAPLQIGVVAQELETVSPGLVDEHPDYEEVEVTDEEGNVTTERQPTGTSTKSVKYSVLYMKAIKALQEAMTRIEALEAEVAALKGAN